MHYFSFLLLFLLLTTTLPAQIHLQFRKVGALHNPPPHTSPLFELFFLKKRMTDTKKRPPLEEDYDFHKPLFTAFSS